MKHTRIALFSQSPDFPEDGNFLFSPADAAQVLRIHGYANNRKLSPSHIAKLSEYMRRGQWLDKSTLDFAKLPDGRAILVNGHHRLAAQASIINDIVWNVVVHKVDREEDVRGLYYRFDTEVRKRSSSNIVHGIGLSERCDLNQSNATALWNATSLIANGFSFNRVGLGGSNVLMDERVALSDKYAPQASLFSEYIETSPGFLRIKLRRASTFASALITLKYQPEKAQSFWAGLCADDGLTKGDPRKTLLNDLQVRTASAGLAAAPAMAIAKSWNAYIKGRELRLLRIAGGEIAFLGTAFKVTS